MADQPTSPDGLYQQAWQIVKNYYVDKTFNGQNWDAWEQRYSGKLKTFADAHLAIKTMVASLGNSNVALLPPIDKADQLVATALAPVKGKGGNPVVTMVRSEPSEVRSAKLSVNQNSSKLGYIRIEGFTSRNCKRDFSRAISEISSCNGLILDLRDNQGGLLAIAEDCALFLLSRGLGETKMRSTKQPKIISGDRIRYIPIVYSTIDKDGYELIQTAWERPANYVNPLVILINHKTSAAASMFAEALKENERAVLVGTHGNESPQMIESVYDLLDGSALRISTVRWLTPLGNDFGAAGIQPDVVVKLTAKDKLGGKGPWWWLPATNKSFPVNLQDLQLLRALETLKDSVNRSAKPISRETSQGFSFAGYVTSDSLK